MSNRAQLLIQAGITNQETGTKLFIDRPVETGWKDDNSYQRSDLCRKRTRKEDRSYFKPCPCNIYDEHSWTQNI